MASHVCSRSISASEFSGGDWAEMEGMELSGFRWGRGSRPTAGVLSYLPYKSRLMDYFVGGAAAWLT